MQTAARASARARATSTSVDFLHSLWCTYVVCNCAQVEVYSQQKDSWDAVLTCFFIDTAKNVLDYISAISTCLKPGGVWINLGPLLYHFEEMDDTSIELSMEEIFAVMDSYGLERVRQEEDVACAYTSNLRSMMRMQYHAVMFTAINNK